MCQLVATSYFERRAAKFRRAHPELRSRLARVLIDLQADPFQPRLRLHALAGDLEGLHAVRLNYEFRMVLQLKRAEQEIYLINIGSHDDVYR